MLPVIKLESLTSTTNSIKIKVKTSRNQGGKVKYYIKAEDEDKYELKETKTDDSEYTYGDLIQGKKYNIKVIAKAENGQTAEVTAEQTTGSIANLTAGDIAFTYTVDGKIIDKSTWTNGTVKVSAKINPEIDMTGLKIQTSKDGKNYEDADTQSFTENGTMYVVLTDGKNYGGSAGGTVTNIDKIKPTIEKSIGSTTTGNTGTINVSNIIDINTNQLIHEGLNNKFKEVEEVNGKNENFAYLNLDGGNKLIKKEIAKDIGFQNYDECQDEIFILSCYSKANKLSFINEQLYYKYEDNSNKNLKNQIQIKDLKDGLVEVKKLYKDAGKYEKMKNMLTFIAFTRIGMRALLELNINKNGELKDNIRGGKI